MHETCLRAIPYDLNMAKSSDLLPLSPADLHVLLVLADRDLYGYAILKAVEEESSGHVRPDLGALYRALARLTTAGLVCEAKAPKDEAPAPGQKRRYFGLSVTGRRTLVAEVARLERVLDLAGARLGLSAEAGLTGKGSNS